MSLRHSLTAFTLLIVIAFGAVTSLPLIREKISLPTASADPVISIDGSAAHNNIYYIRAGEPSPRTIIVTTNEGKLSYLSIDHLPHGISVTQSSATALQIIVKNVDISDEELPASYGITISATSASGPEELADIIFVIEPRGGQKPFVMFDKPTYQAGETASIIVLDSHVDCNVHELNDGRNPFVEVTVNGPGGFFADPVRLDRDEFSTNLFRGSLIIDTSGSGQMTVTYPRAVVTPSPCVWPTGIQSAQDQADLSMARIGFNSTVYTTADDTGAIGTTNGVTLTIVDDAAPPAVFATISAGATPGLGAVGDSSVLGEAVRVGGLQVPLTQDPGTNTYRFTGSIESLLNSAGLNKADFNQWPISINATYLDNRPDPDPVAVTTVFATRELSFVVPEGRSFYLSNDTATIELIDPVANSNVNDFNTAMITLCSYNATGGDNRFVIGGKSEIPLLEVGRNTGKFVSGYQLAFINASFNINDIPQDPSDWQPAGQPTAQPVNERELFSQSHIRVLNNQTTQVIAVVGPLANCWPTVPSSLVLKEMIHNSFTVEPSVVSDPDSGGRGQNVGALVHADPPLVTASLINCSLYGGDTDEDGLCNNWETGSGLKVWYPSGSANFYVFTYVNDPYPNPNHKDMLVEIDHVNNANGPAGCSNTVSYKPSSTAIANIKNAFNKGDVTNPDSVRGIKLHIYYTSGGGEEILPSTCVTGISVWYDNPATPGTTNTFDEVKQLYFGSSTERASTDKGKAKWQAFHYCLFIPKQTQDTSSSGVAEQLGNDCVVSLGIGGYFDNSVDEQQGTLMHELGHNLGLYHGGPNVSGNDYNINCKPNYPSVMSYVRQTTNPYSNASLTYSDDKMTSFDVPGNPFISSVDPNEVNVLKLSASSILSSIQIVWGVSSGGTMPPPANIGKTTAADIDWSNAGGINNSNSPPGTGEVNMLGISGCTSGDTVDDKLSGADDWNGIETSGNMNFREKNPDSFATGFQAPQQSETPTQYWALEPNTNTSRQTRAQFINTTNDLVQNIANCSDPAIDSDKASYDVGDEIVITIADGDANQRTNVEDSLEHIRVYSDSDPVGLEFTADETGVSTGVFEFDFDTSGQIENDTNTITVASSDDVTITYTDACSQDVTVPRDFSLIVGIDHVVSTNVTKAILLGPGKMEYEDRLVLNSDSVRMLVLNQSGEASEKVSVEKAIEELKGLRMSLDGFDGGNATDDSFKESQRAVETLKFLTDAIRSLQFALDIPYQKEPFEIKSLGLDCGGIEGCTITGYSDTATSTVENFRIDPDKKRITFHGTGQGDLILQGSTDIMPIKNVQSATTRQDFEFEAVNSTAVLLKDLPYNFKDIAVFYGQDLVAPSSPMLRALNGSSLLQAVNGSDSMISVGLTNYELALNLTDFWRNFTAIIEVRNEDDLTVFLGWQTGLLEPDSFGCVLCKTEVGMSWTPNELGNYKIRTFVLTDFEQPRILSGVKETSIMVVD